MSLWLLSSGVYRFNRFAKMLGLLLVLHAAAAIHWNYDPWSPCAPGDATQRRQVWCEDRLGTRLKPDLCPKIFKPALTRPCPHNRWPSGWEVGPWGPCRHAADGCDPRSAPGLTYRWVRCGEESPCPPDLRPPHSAPCSAPCRPFSQGCVVSTAFLGPWWDAGNGTRYRARRVVGPCPYPPQLLQSKPLVKARYDPPPHPGTMVKVEPWEPCISGSILGLRRRRLSCIIGECPEIIREESCIVPRNCSVGPWSSWKILEEGCENSQGEIFPWLWTRSRNVTHPPRAWGLPCPHLVETKKVWSPLTPCELRYRWKTFEWRKCQPIEDTLSLDDFCNGGIQIRAVYCIRVKDGTPVSRTLCKERMPSIVRPCLKPCPVDCQVSHWSSWSRYQPMEQRGMFDISLLLYRTRSREVLTLPRDGGAPCPHLQEMETLKEGHIGNIIFWKQEKETPCIPLGGSCGLGSRSPTFVCSFMDERVIPDVWCELYSRNLDWVDTSEECEVPCPGDCIQTEWRDSLLCEPRLKMYRSTLAAASGGKPCGPTVKFDKCQSDDEDTKLYFWKATPWGPCLPSANPEMGIQYRNVSLHPKHEQEIEDKLAQPPASQPCPLPVLQDCMVSNFSDWSPCLPVGITRIQTRVRFRVSGSNATCPHLTEMRKCPAPPTYVWSISRWSHTGLCNTTLFRFRAVYCMDASHRPVPVELCPDPLFRSWEQLHCSGSCMLSQWSSWSSGSSSFGTTVYRSRQLISQGEGCQHHALEDTYTLPPTSVMTDDSVCLLPESSLCGTGKKISRFSDSDTNCSIPCPNDCKLESWSSWTPCNNTCGLGYRTRSRKVLVFNNPLGHPCPMTPPSELEEVDICTEPCHYSWQVVSPWQNCQLPSNVTCGQGESTRDVCCLDLDRNVRVLDKLCRGLAKPIATQPCEVKCPGDCVESPWTEWGHCLDGQQQKRSRHVLRPPTPPGKPCGSLEEWREPCPVPQARWLAGNWGSCIQPSPLAKCGPGHRRRPLLCQDAVSGLVLNATLCANLTKPPTTFNCSTPCRLDCILSPWRDWDNSSCKPCSLNGNMTLRRYLVQAPSPTGIPCPDLHQTAPCPYHPCFHLFRGDWSTCLPYEGAHCGVGTRKRWVTCHRGADNLTVPIHFCTANVTSLPYYEDLDPEWIAVLMNAQTEEECSIPCPGEDRTPPWSEWSSCYRADCHNEILGLRFRTLIGPAHTNKPQWDSQPCLDYPCLTFSGQPGARCFRSDGLEVQGGCPLNTSAERLLYQEPRFYPDDEVTSGWMVALLVIGSLFIAAVVATSILTCRSTIKSRLVGRQASIRRHCK